MCKPFKHECIHCSSLFFNQFERKLNAIVFTIGRILLEVLDNGRGVNRNGLWSALICSFSCVSTLVRRSGLYEKFADRKLEQPGDKFARVVLNGLGQDLMYLINCPQNPGLE